MKFSDFSFVKEENNIKFYEYSFVGTTITQVRHPFFPFPVPTPVQTEIKLVIAEHLLNDELYYSIVIHANGRADQAGPFHKSDLENKLNVFSKIVGIS